MLELETSLVTERNRRRELRLRLERQAQEYQVALAEADQTLLHTQQELDKVGIHSGRHALVRNIYISICSDDCTYRSRHHMRGGALIGFMEVRVHA